MGILEFFSDYQVGAIVSAVVFSLVYLFSYFTTGFQWSDYLITPFIFIIMVIVVNVLLRYRKVEDWR